MKTNKSQGGNLSMGNNWESFYLSLLLDDLEEVRPKTYQAIKRVFKSMSGHEQQILIKYIKAIIAPESELKGCCVPIESGTDCVAVYLSAVDEGLPRSYLDWIVAHEFAHVALKHHKIRKEQVKNAELEEQANAKALSWGFKNPNEMKRG